MRSNEMDLPEPDLAYRDGQACEVRETVEVHLRDLKVAADIGIFGHEIGRRQALIITVVLVTDVPAGDAIEHAVDYNRLAEEAHALAERRICLIETFARTLARTYVSIKGVRSANVYIEKPAALTNGVAGTRVVVSR